MTERPTFNPESRPDPIPDKGFAEQWSNPETLDFDGEKVEVHDVRPEKEKTDVSVVFMPGWGTSPEVFKKDLKVLHENDRRVLAVDAPHGVEHQISTEEAEGLPDAELKKVAALIKTLDAKGVDKVDAVGTSEGGMVVTMAAWLYPERFRNLLLEYPTGMIGKDSLLALAVRFPKDMIKSQIDGMLDPERRAVHDQEMAGLKEATAGRASRKVVPAVKQVQAMATTQIHNMLRDIKKRGHRISIIHGAHDNVFPMDRVQKTTTTDMVDGFYSIKGKHGEWRTTKERHAYGRLAEHALEAMERKK